MHGACEQGSLEDNGLALQLALAMTHVLLAAGKAARCREAEPR